MTNSLVPQRMLVQLDDAFVKRRLRERRAYILDGIGDRTIEPTDELMHELSIINIELGEVPTENEAFQ